MAHKKSRMSQTWLIGRLKSHFETVLEVFRVGALIWPLMLLLVIMAVMSMAQMVRFFAGLTTRLARVVVVATIANGHGTLFRSDASGPFLVQWDDAVLY